MKKSISILFGLVFVLMLAMYFSPQTKSYAAAVPKAEQVTYCASKNSKVFHKCSCIRMKLVKSANVVKFNSREEAVKSGRHACKICKP